MIKKHATPIAIIFLIIAAAMIIYFYGRPDSQSRVTISEEEPLDDRAFELALLPSEDVFGELEARDVYPNLPEVNPEHYRWVDIDPSSIAKVLFSNGALKFDDKHKGFVELQKRDKHSSPASYMRHWAVVKDHAPVKTWVIDDAGKRKRAFVTPEACLVQIVYPDDASPDGKLANYPITGWHLKSVEVVIEPMAGVDFELDKIGAETMNTITSNHSYEGAGDDERHLAVIIEDRIISAPTINAPLSDRIQITGSISLQEASAFAHLLRRNTGQK